MKKLSIAVVTIIAVAFIVLSAKFSYQETYGDKGLTQIKAGMSIGDECSVAQRIIEAKADEVGLDKNVALALIDKKQITEDSLKQIFEAYNKALIKSEGNIYLAYVRYKGNKSVADYFNTYKFETLTADDLVTGMAHMNQKDLILSLRDFQRRYEAIVNNKSDVKQIEFN